MLWFTLFYVVDFMLRVLWIRDRETVISGGAGVELWPRKLATARFLIEDMKIVKKAVPNAVCVCVCVCVCFIFFLRKETKNLCRVVTITFFLREMWSFILGGEILEMDFV
jgi:hypothetical protein